MQDFFTKLFDTSDFPPRWYCGSWSSGLGWLHIISDVAVWAAYTAIPIVLVLYIRKRKDFPYHRILWLFAAFILACGSVHLAEAMIFWYPFYRVSGLLKLLTAIVSWATVLALMRITPHVLHWPSLVATNERLTEEIDERRQMEMAIRDSEARAHQANLAKSQFLANMSHEIRTPMAAILGYADVLMGHLKDPDNRNCVLVMKRNGEHLLEIINDILDLSRIEAGKLEIDLHPCDLPQLIGDIQSLMQVRADEKQLNLHFVSAGLIPKIVLLDSTRMRQVLVNLIGNAIKFSDQGDVTMITRLLVEDSSPTLEFEVTDTGIGMSDEQQARLFQPFSQGDPSVTRAYGGSGLGLAISQRFVEMHGGTILIKSSLGVGSSFYVRIPPGPLQDVPMIELDLNHRPQPLDSAERRRTLNCRVLVVDDRRDVRYISQHFLEAAGATVSTAEDGQQGIDAVKRALSAETPFDVIVMDMQMPNLDGRQATAELRSMGVEKPIIALTADAMKGDRENCLRAGCDDYISKPIDHTLFVDMVARYSQDFTIDQLRERRFKRAQQLKETFDEK